jgi:uncharacterized protein
MTNVPAPVPRSTLQRPIVLLPSGNTIDLANLDPESWSDDDLALGLARTYRWGGHSRWPRPLSVAQHSLTVLAIRERDGPLPPQLALYELLHDAEEGLLGFDAIAPLKAFLGEPFRDLCARLSAAIAVRYGLPELSSEQLSAHKHADRVAAASEAMHVAGWSKRQIVDKLEITETPLDRDPLEGGFAGRDFTPWEPWTDISARSRWLARLRLELARADASAKYPT